jgi:flagellar biosynthesis chaperone FliJ
MKRYPLQTLLQLREHRTETARLAVLEKQRALQHCIEACARVQDELTGLERDRHGHRARLLDPPPSGVPWPAALTQREAHIDLLGEQIVGANQRLSKAQEAVRQAEAAVQDARDAFFRAKGRQDALEKRRDMWKREQRGLFERQEEAINEDLMQARYMARK